MEKNFFNFYTESTELKIYIDMDGVLSDFNKAFENLGNDVTNGLSGPEFQSQYGKKAFWTAIENAGNIDFWKNMPWMNDGKHLWNFVKLHNPTILSSPSRSPLCIKGKKIWIERELCKNIPSIFIKNKYEYANENSILIDDTEQKILDWNRNGGIGILHHSAEDTIRKLNGYGI